jgi:hypothetical protein
MSTNLSLDQVAENQASKEITINTATGQIDAALTERLSVSVSTGNVTVTDTNYRRNAALFITAATTSGRTVTLPAIKKTIIIFTDSTNTQSISVVRGSTTFSMSPGKVATFYTDGTTNGLTLLSGDASGGTVTKPFDLGTFCAGVPDASEILMRYVFTRAVSFPASLTGSQVKAGTAATAQTDFVLAKNGSSIGTIRFAASGATATFVSVSATSFAAGDILSITAPGTADATLADISFTLAGERL